MGPAPCERHLDQYPDSPCLFYWHCLLLTKFKSVGEFFSAYCNMDRVVFVELRKIECEILNQRLKANILEATKFSEAARHVHLVFLFSWQGKCQLLWHHCWAVKTQKKLSLPHYQLVQIRSILVGNNKSKKLQMLPLVSYDWNTESNATQGKYLLDICFCTWASASVDWQAGRYFGRILALDSACAGHVFAVTSWTDATVLVT